MSEAVRLDTTSRPHRVWLAIPLVIFALVSLTVGLLANRTIRSPYSTPFFHPFFSDTLHMKVWLVTAVLALGFLQLLTAARIFTLVHFPPKGRFYNVVHRWSGRTALALTLPLAYHCVFLLGFGGVVPCRAIGSGVASRCIAALGVGIHDGRVLVHSLLGSTLYGTVITKVLLVRSTRFPPWALPVAGGVLFATLLGLWLTSALWFFATPTLPGHGFGF